MGTVIASAIRLIAIVIFLCFKTQCITGSYILIKKFVTGFLFSGLNFPRISIVIKTGIKVISTIAEPASINVFVNARGLNNFPS